jgi:histidine triad (HIT) family protein
MTIFSKIIKKEIPAEIVFEDEHCLAFKDIHPQAPIHILMIPKREIPSLADLRPEDQPLVGHMLVKIAEIAAKLGIAQDGYRVVTNVRAFGGQTVHHLHFHLMGGRPFSWPPG